MRHRQLTRRRSVVSRAIESFYKQTVMEALERRLMYAAITWTGGSSGDWATPGNWDLNRAPNSGDDVTIGAGSTVSVTTTGQAALTLNVAGTLVVADSSALSVSQGGTVNNLTINNGSFSWGQFGNSPTVTGAFNWTGGTLASNGGGVAITLSGTSTFTGATNKVLFTALNVTGTLNHGGAGNLALVNGNSDLTIAAGGVYNFTGDGDITDNGSAAFGAVVTVQGTLRKSGGTESIVNVEGYSFVLTGGTIASTTGTLIIDRSTGTFAGGSINASGGGIVRFTSLGGSWGGAIGGTGDGRVEIVGGTLNNDVNNALTLNFAPNLLFVSAAMSGFTNAGTLLVTGTSSFGSRVINTGSFVVTDGATLTNGSFTNNAGGVLELRGAPTIDTTTIDNAGILRKTAAGTATIGSSVTLNLNTGSTVDATAGTLAFNASTRLNSTAFTVASGARVEFQRSVVVSGTVTGSGAGVIDLTAGQLRGDGVADSTFNFSPNLFRVTGGQIVGTGTTVRTINAGFVDLMSANNENLIQGTVYSTGTMRVPAGMIVGANNSVLSIESGGVLELADTAKFFRGTINVAGTLRKATGAGSATIESTDVSFLAGNSAQVPGGRLEIIGATARLDGFNAQVGAGADLKFSSSVFIKGTITGTGAGTVTFAGGLQSSDVNNLNFPDGMGIITPSYIGGDSAPLRNTGFITFGGTGDFTYRAFIENTGTVHQSYVGTSIAYGFAVIKNLAGGVWELTDETNIRFVDFQNSGTLRVNAAGKTATVESAVTNSGDYKIQALAGTLLLKSGGTYPATQFDAAPGAEIRFGGSNFHTFQSGTFTSTGTGTVRIAGPIQATAGQPQVVLNFTDNVLQVDDGTQLFGPLNFAGTTTVVAPTSIFMNSAGNDPVRNTGTFNYTGAGTFQIYVSYSFTNDGTFNLASDADFQIVGVNIGDTPTGIINNGLFHKTAGTGVSELIDPNNLALARFDNQGTVQVSSGTLRLGESVGQLTREFAGGNGTNVLTGGTWTVDTGGTLELPGGTNLTPTDALPPINTNRATVILRGSGGTFTQFAPVTRNEGTIRVNDARTFTTAGNLTNTGTIRAGSRGRFVVNGALNNTGTLEFVIAGSPTSGLFGTIASSGPATLGGTASVTLAGGFGPSNGNAYTLLTYPSKAGDFASITGLDPYFQSTVSATSFSLNASGGVSPVDLAPLAGSSTVPTTAAIGQSATISYTVSNLSTGPAPAGSTDSLFLSTDTILDPADQLIGRFTSPGVAGSGTYTGNVTAALPGVPAGTYRVLVVADSLQTLADTNRANNVVALDGSIAVTVPVLTLNTPVNSTIANAQDLYFKLTLTQLSNLLLDLTFTNDQQAEVFVRRGQLPTRVEYDQALPAVPDRSPSLLVNDAVAGDYYLLVHGKPSAASGSAFTINASALTFGLTSITPDSVGRGVVRTTITGAGFTSAAQLSLVDQPGVPVTVTVLSPSKLSATFDTSALAEGTYTIRLTQGGQTSDLPGALTVTSTAVAGEFVADIVMPRYVRGGRVFNSTLEYRNSGGTEIISPLMLISSPSLSPFTLNATDEPLLVREFVYAAGDGFPRGVLTPGERISLPVRVLADKLGVSLQVDFVDETSDGAWDWQAFKRDMPERFKTEPDFEQVFAAMAQRIGATQGDFVRMLSRNATDFAQAEGDPRNVYDLTVLEMRRVRASLGASISGTLTSTDPRLPLADMQLTAINVATNESITTTTLATGGFIFDRAIVAGTYEIRVRGALVTDPAARFMVAASTPLTGIAIAVERGTSFRGTVTAPDSTPVFHAFVRFYGPDGTVKLAAITDENGFYETDPIDPDAGPFALSVESAFYARTSIVGIDPAFGENVQNVQMNATARLTARIVAAGVPKSSFVVLEGDPAVPNSDYFAETGDDGLLNLEAIAAGTYTLMLATADGLVNEQTVTLVSDQTLALGDIEATAFTPPAPQFVPGPQAPLALTPHFINRATNPEARDSFQIPAIEKMLEVAEAWVSATWLPGAATLWGVSNAEIWRKYVTGDSNSVPEYQHYTEGSDFVEGGWTIAANGYRKDAQYRNESSPGINNLYRNIINTIETKFAIDEIDCTELARQPMTYTFLELGYPGNVPVRYHGSGSIPGNTAGGDGTPPTPVGSPHGGAFGQVHGDERYFRGSVTVSLIAPGVAKLSFNAMFHAEDTVDFLPGSLGEGPEQIETRALALLETYDRAYDVPFDVVFKDDFYFADTTIQIPDTATHNNDCDDPEPIQLNRQRRAAIATALQRLSADPNSKESTGVVIPNGDGAAFNRAGSTIGYTINFENLPSATANAQEVFVTDVLDEDLDLATFELGDVAFGDQTIDVPSGRQFYQTRLDLSESRGFVVDFTAELDVETRTVTYTFQTIDPATNELITDAVDGFLPPEDGTGRGQGYVSYFVATRDDAVDGTRVDNDASIVFDVNAPIITNSTVNIVDEAVPGANVLALPASSEPTFTLNWAGTDAASGVAVYDVYVSRDGGPFTPFLSNTDLTSASFTGEVGSTYGFYAVATDRVGLIGANAAAAQTSTVVVEPRPASATATVAPDPQRPGKNRLTVTGTNANDSILVDRNSRAYGDRVRVRVNGAFLGVFTDVRSIRVDAGAGNDYVRVESNIRADVSVFGGDGDDKLRAGQHRAALFGEAGSDRLISTARYGVLVGGTGRDTLDAGRGKDVLIGGNGADDLHGGNGQDLLIAGPTTYDANPDQAILLRDTWSGGSSFSSRKRFIESAEFSARLVAGQTVLNDSVTDSLNGDGDANWFFADRSGASGIGDILSSLRRETVTDLVVQNA